MEKIDLLTPGLKEMSNNEMKETNGGLILLITVLANAAIQGIATLIKNNSERNDNNS